MPQNHKIVIVVDQVGALSYVDDGGNDKYKIKVYEGDQVSWKCMSHDYGIQFTNYASPFENEILSLSKTMGQTTDPCTVKKPPRPGGVHFKYAVSVHIPGNSNPIVIDDPVIIVEDA